MSLFTTVQGHLRLLAAAAWASVIAAVGYANYQQQPSAAPPPSPPVVSPATGEPFLPAYLDMLAGKKPFPHDACPAPLNLFELPIPCDTPESP